MIDIIFFWDNNYYNNPKLNIEEIIFAEKSLKVKLPILFIELLKIQNGGYTRGFTFPMIEETSWSKNHVPLNELFGIVKNKNLKSAHNILDSEYLINEWDLPQSQVLISGDGHYFITLDYRISEIPNISWIDVDSNEDIIIANNFEEFINGLVSIEDFS